MADIDPREYLNAVGSLQDSEIDLAPAAICLAAREYEERNFQRYFHHLKVLADEVGENHAEMLKAGAEDNAETQIAALKNIITDKHGYIGNSEDYDNLQNADLIAVIDKRKGLPIALCILYIHAAKAQGWVIDGLSLPGHFVVRLEKDGRRIIFDPFYGGGILEAPQLREIVKRALGPNAELSSHYFEAAQNREILVRLQNNIKLRQIDAGDYEEALKTIEHTRLIAPQEFRLLLDAGVLYSKTGQPKAAISALESYIEQVDNPQHRYDAELLLQELISSLN